MHTNHILRLSDSPSLPYWTALVLNWQNCHRLLCPSSCCSVVFYQLCPPASLLLIRLTVDTRSPCCSNQASSVPVHSLIVSGLGFNAVIQLCCSAFPALSFGRTSWFRLRPSVPDHEFCPRTSWFSPACGCVVFMRFSF